jgi:predicted GNAT superfamily acetyltransferase
VEYVQDMYGDNLDSKTDSVIGSDRLIVRWDLDGEPRPSPGIPVGLPSGALVTLDPVILDASVGVELPDEPRVSIEIPPDIQELKGTRPDLARAWRVLTRRAFVHSSATIGDSDASGLAYRPAGNPSETQGGVPDLIRGFA